jgi:hypothetical protein
MNQALTPVTWGQRLNMAINKTSAFNWLDRTITPAAEKIESAKTTIAAVVANTANAATIGTKYGIIILFAIMGLFFIAQFKSLTAAFKE